MMEEGRETSRTSARSATDPISAVVARTLGISRRPRHDAHIGQTLLSVAPATLTLGGSKSCTNLAATDNGQASMVKRPGSASLPRPASAPLIKDVGEPLGSGAQAIVRRATLSSSKQQVALVIGKQPIPQATRDVLYLLAAQRPKHVVAVLHPDVATTDSKAASHGQARDAVERFIAIQECTCSLADILSRNRNACTRKGFFDAVQHLVAHAEADVDNDHLSHAEEQQHPFAPLCGCTSGDIAGDQPLAGQQQQLGQDDDTLTHSTSCDPSGVPSATTASSDNIATSADDHPTVSEAFLAGLARHILIGLRGLHNLGLAHNDVKISNVLFDKPNGAFLLGDLLNASFADRHYHDNRHDDDGDAAHATRHRCPASLRGLPFRTDIKAFALLMLQTAQLVEQHGGDDVKKPTTLPFVSDTPRASSHYDPIEFLRLADDGALTGCDDWIPWSAVENLWARHASARQEIHSATPSPKFQAFVKEAFCGAEPKVASHGDPHSVVGVSTFATAAHRLLEHPFLTQYGRTNEQWKQLLKAAFSDDANPPEGSACGRSSHKASTMHRRTATASSHGSCPSTPVVPSPMPGDPIIAALFPHSPSSRAPSSPTLDELSSATLLGSSRGSTSGLFPPQFSHQHRCSHSHRVPIPLRLPPGRR